MANMLAMGLDPVQQAIRQRLNSGAVVATEPIVPAVPEAAAASAPASLSPEFAPAAMPAAPSGAPNLASAIRTKIAPTMGATRTFPNGRTGQWDGTGWLHVG
jgi:hypothetical protein